MSEVSHSTRKRRVHNRVLYHISMSRQAPEDSPSLAEAHWNPLGADRQRDIGGEEKIGSHNESKKPSVTSSKFLVGCVTLA